MGSLVVVPFYPCIEILLQGIDAFIELLAEGNSVELFLHRSVKPLANAVRLRTLCFRLRVIDVLDGHVELVFMLLPLAALLCAPVRQYTKQLYLLQLKEGALDSVWPAGY